MFIICLLLWIIFSASLSWESLLTGVVVAGLVYIFCWRQLGYSPKSDLKALRKIAAIFKYIGILVWETALSNIAVSRLVFARRIEVSPCILFFKTDLKGKLSRVVLANSITLTPGTITLALFDDIFCVHCLDKGMAEGIEDSSFVQQLHSIEGSSDSEK